MKTIDWRTQKFNNAHDVKISLANENCIDIDDLTFYHGKSGAPHRAHEYPPKDDNIHGEDILTFRYKWDIFFKILVKWP